MAGTAKKSDPKLWEGVKEEVTEGGKGGKPGQWSARKAQMAVSEYKAKGGGYEGKKSPDNHLSQWTEEEWGTKSGKKSGETGERYLPKEAREALMDDEYTRTSAKKRADTRRGKQFSKQPEDVARKAAAHRDGGQSKAAMMEKAKARGIVGRSRMSRAQLAEALGMA